MTNSKTVAELDKTLGTVNLTGRLRLIADSGRPAVFPTSLGIEDQVITAAIAAGGLDIRIVTLDTGRLFPETEALITETETRFNIRIERFRPETAAVDDYVKNYGRNGFYESVEARHACCQVRKLEPLARALDGAAYWITGLRRGQYCNRATTPYA